MPPAPLTRALCVFLLCSADWAKEIAEEEETESPPTQVDADPTGEEGGGVEL